MFNIGAPEFFVILIVALIVFGPEKMVQMSGQIARFIRDFQSQARSMQETFTSALNEAQEQLQQPQKELTNIVEQQHQEFRSLFDSTNGTGQQHNGLHALPDEEPAIRLTREDHLNGAQPADEEPVRPQDYII